jgi:hypothetical protein
MSPNTAGVTNLVDPQTRLIAINGSGGAKVLISASVMAGYVEIQEWPLTPSSQLQGLSIQRSDENYANTYPLPPGSIWSIGDSVRKNRCEGVPSFTYPDNVVRPATPWIEVISATATATQVMVREWRQQYNN